jgi:hypothetical protein
MRRSQRNVWLAAHCAVAVVALGSCEGLIPKPADDRAPHPEVASAQPTCTQWDAYDADWHRRHCDDPIHWCTLPDTVGTTGGGTTGTTGGAGSKGSATGAAGGAGSAGVGGAAGHAGSTGDAGAGGGAGGAASGGAAGGAAGSTASGGAAGTGAGGTVAPIDAGASGGDAGVSVGGAPDGGHASADAGPTGGQGACVVGTSCPQGTSCVSGSCQSCPAGVCTCQRDDDCSAMQICDHDTATCTSPPPACTALVTEAACAVRVDCTPFYGGMSCTNNVGSPCHSGEANCTCATYSFAACVARD